MSEEQFAALSIVGKGAAIVCVLAAIYAIVSAVALMPRLKRLNEISLGVWQDAELRPKFLRFVGFCGVGVLAALVGFTYGGWPQG